MVLIAFLVTGGCWGKFGGWLRSPTDHIEFTSVDKQCYDESVMATNVVATITAPEAQAAASLFLSDNLGDRFLASSPKLDIAAKVWRVPILLAYPIIGPVGQTGEILVNETTEEIISYTPLEQMKATARRLYEENRDPIEASVP